MNHLNLIPGRKDRSRPIDSTSHIFSLLDLLSCQYQDEQHQYLCREGVVIHNHLTIISFIVKITYSFPECTWNSVGGVNPTICVENIFWNVFGVNTIYGITNILSCSHYQRECQQKCHCGSIMETKDTGVYSHMMGLHQTLESAKYFQHFV